MPEYNELVIIEPPKKKRKIKRMNNTNNTNILSTNTNTNNSNSNKYPFIHCIYKYRGCKTKYKYKAYMDKHVKKCSYKPKVDVINLLDESESEEDIDIRPVHERNLPPLIKHELLLRANI